ncbi:2,3-diphosphoglycerate-dependent phosphoglycerate mutase [Weissella tructae]|jgi:2,3-bisphosphoglycerate-dependent phosphoglycerate mutase|uniref:2,3-bisphosphoglycerate-dependent phosphoglycerate mutase n=2 Tax=Weissella TaxID=46255 RepID=A0A075TXV7_9LACO|nr:MULTISPECIES: 2,3-diphosphoglycerate-dependent phosphoglycerate mutase [Weissella]AIG65035.1 2,3-bisphosphoglycerate-dependent phosphoglycerate mutase [Weissella tructae]AIM62347.1 2,3-bisphosphoglycerate-dependent phosphoglycerate mutase [Weissella ceti]AIM63686.1 2,3-bisphosphoglycerate-dependent phosphoglycerate mutase [Weissella ceti]ELA07772.1 phosphoglycerate mutase [Weissella ceti NC36]QVV91439.1 2,3-diphosphoglycerate-dependent phosphoglycerate mutase [Weissella tructae]
MAKLVMIRHGQSEWNAKNLFNGWVDTKLSPVGIEQAKTAGKMLAEAGIDFDQAYTSVLTRAIETLDLTLFEAGQMFIPEEKSWRLNERNYGALQGLNKADAAEKFGADQVLQWRRSYDVLPPLLESAEETVEVEGQTYASYDRRYAEVAAEELPLGENLKVTLERVMPFWNEKISADLKAGKNVVIAAHGNSLRALAKHIEQISDEDILGLEIANAQPIIYDFDGDLNVLSKDILTAE